MINQIVYTDPLLSLYSYLNDIKPYHTKIVEVLAEYTYTDAINATIVDKMFTNIDQSIDYNESACDAGFDAGLFGDDTYSGIEYRYPANDTSVPPCCRAESDDSAYVSPTTVVPTFSEFFQLLELVELYDDIAVTVYDWTNENYLLDAIGFDTPYYGVDYDEPVDTIYYDDNWYDIYGYDTPGLNDVARSFIDITELLSDNIHSLMVDGTESTEYFDNNILRDGFDGFSTDLTINYDYTAADFSTSVTTDGFTNADMNYALEVDGYVGADVNAIHTISDGFDETPYDNAYPDLPDDKTVASQIRDVLQIIETVELYDIIGVTICDPNYDGSTWANDWGMDTFWTQFFPNQTGWATSPLWDNNRGQWFGGQNGVSWVCIPGSLVGGFDDSYGFDFNTDGPVPDGDELQNFDIGSFDAPAAWNSLGHPSDFDDGDYFPDADDDTLPYDDFDGFGEGTFDTYNDEPLYDVCLAQQNPDSPITILHTDGPLTDVTVYFDVPTLTLNIVHLLNRYPIVRVFMDNGVEIHPASITHVTNNSVTIVFTTLTTGTVRLL